MRRRSRLVGLLWRWHRRLGVVAAVFAVLLALTGIILNHSSQLGMDRRFVDWQWLLGVYGDESGNLPAFQLGELWLHRAADGQVYLDALAVAPCNGPLVGAVSTGGLLVAVCAEELLLVTPGGELVESIGSGLPAPLLGVGLVAGGNTGQVALQSAQAWWLADLEQADFSQRAPGGAFINQLAAGRLPEQIREQLPAQPQWLSWERVMQDLHSGRLAGKVGVLWMDLVALLLASLAMSGVAMWWLHRRRRRRHSQGVGG
jgi:hypothetical protein